jgi:hypothetical protein
VAAQFENFRNAPLILLGLRAQKEQKSPKSFKLELRCKTEKLNSAVLSLIAPVPVSVEKLLISNITYRSCSLTDKNAEDHDQL